MAKKEEGFSFRKVITELGASILGEGVRTVADEIKEKVQETIHTAQLRVEETLKHALKVIMLYIIIFIGFIFVLVGFARYLGETMPALDHGLGFVLVGMVLVLMGLFASWTSK
jgi:hypothetical protein